MTILFISPVRLDKVPVERVNDKAKMKSRGKLTTKKKILSILKVFKGFETDTFDFCQRGSDDFSFDPNVVVHLNFHLHWEK